MRSTYLFENAEEKEKKGLGIAIVTLLGKSGVASRRESRMIVYSDATVSGTIGGGALLEYLGKQPFIQAGDVIEMKVEGLGSLRMEVK